MEQTQVNIDKDGTVKWEDYSVKAKVRIKRYELSLILSIINTIILLIILFK